MSYAIGWYGPQIDLCKAESHIGDFVQLLVFIHRSTPVQYKLPKGGEVVRTDIQVGDESRPFFVVSLWQKKMGDLAAAGDVVLLQNVKIARFGQVVEARSEQCSSLVRLVQSYQNLISKGVEELTEESGVVKLAKKKLAKVIKWAQRDGSALYNIALGSQGFKQKNIQCRNWKVAEQIEPRTLLSLLDVMNLTTSCKTVFNGFVGEIFLPITWRFLAESEKEKMFISRRTTVKESSDLVEDFICVGCHLCGSPLQTDDGFKQKSASLYGPKSSNCVHAVSSIYRPFMLYVWDESDYLPLLVRNKAAEILFGNIKAERVKTSSDRERTPRSFDIGITCSQKPGSGKSINFHLIWVMLLKMLLEQDKNGPLKFEVDVNPTLDSEYGRFEVSSVSIPCSQTRLNVE
ncbi:hypothetical protein LINPERHAP2_LOCUS44953 [Linum perenne]